MKFLIVNGPNINMLGVREPDIYGTLTYEGLCDTIAQAARGMGVEVEFFQSNSEGDIVTAIQNALGRMDGIVINPAAYTHTSVAILDALKAVALPAAEVHISDVTKREAFRQRSFAGMAGAHLPEGGFLHCSPVEYFWRVAPGHYADGGDYVLLCIDVKKVPAPVKWEAGPHNPSRYYPHIYGACPVSAVTAVLPLRMDSRGQFLKNPELSGYENR